MSTIISPPLPAGSGDVVGPASSTDDALVRYDSTTGKLLQNSTATLSDAGTLTATEFVGGGLGITGVEASAAWGLIGGTLADQLDLQTAIGTKVNSVNAGLATIMTDTGLTPVLSTDANGSLVLSAVSGGATIGFDGSGIPIITGKALLSVDTGWTAPGSGGDKADSVSDFSGGGVDGTMSTALDVVSSGLGAAIVQMEDRIRELIHNSQATQTALVAKLIPNA